MVRSSDSRLGPRLSVCSPDASLARHSAARLPHLRSTVKATWQDLRCLRLLRQHPHMQPAASGSSASVTPSLLVPITALAESEYRLTPTRRTSTIRRKAQVGAGFPARAPWVRATALACKCARESHPIRSASLLYLHNQAATRCQLPSPRVARPRSGEQQPISRATQKQQTKTMKNKTMRALPESHR